AGEPLEIVQQETEKQLDFARKLHFGLIVDIISGQLRLVLALRGSTGDVATFDGPEFDSQRFEHRLDEDPGMRVAIGWYWVRKLQGSVFAGEARRAVDAAVKVEPYLWTMPSHLEVADFHFYAALARASLHDEAAAEDRPSLLEAVRAHHAQISLWEKHCAENFAARAALVAAEIARIEDRELDAERLYERAIASARVNGFIHDEAIANESAARFHAARGLETISDAYLRNARYCYARWGADGKVAQLDGFHPQLKEEPRAEAPPGTIAAPVEHLDLATVIKVSQAVSGEIVLERLMETLMHTAMTQAGAERALLILVRAGAQRIAAEATTTGDTAVVQLRDEPVADSALPSSVLHYVVRTRETIILDDAAVENPFSTDPYVREHFSRSILCLPLLTQGKLIGVLYLENNLSPRVFAPARIAMLKLLASQAAISLENTRLYRDLAEREAKIRRLVDANIIGIFTWQLKGQNPEESLAVIVDVNDAFLHIVGYDREDLVTGSLDQRILTPPEWQDRTQRAMAEMKMTGSFQPYEKEYFRKDGTRVPVLIGAATFERGGSQGVAFVLDLTERKRAEAALLERDATVRGLVDANIIGTFTWRLDKAGGTGFRPVFQDVNDAFLRIVGYNREDLSTTTSTWVLTPPDWVDRTQRAADEMKLNGAFQPYEKEFIRKDGSRVPVLVGAAQTGDTGIAFVLDLTERKHAEAARVKLEERLGQAEKMEAIGRFASGIAHDFNNVLGGIMAFGEMLFDEAPEDAPRKRYAQNVLAAAGRGRELVAQILTYSRRQPGKHEPADACRIVAETLEFLRASLPGSVTLTVSIPDEPLVVIGQATQLHQIVMNLCNNAVQAMNARGSLNVAVTSVDVSAEHPLSHGSLRAARYACLSVEDSGSGMDKATLARIFEPFFTTKEAGRGTGLGLALVYAIVTDLGGAIDVSTAPAQGSRFSLYLPLADMPPSANAP
ncbi:MAG TPA: PAS domain S-box protein, partial [Pseudomonadota bacterium]|nr:PAS domain S-box protein [Pseudomonadota bacterium]